MTIDIDAGLNCSDPRLKALHELWQSRRKARGCLPPRTDFDPIAVRDFIADLYMVDVIDGGARFRYRLIGTAITQRTERDVTGKFFDEIYPPGIIDDFSRSFRWIVEHRLPMRSHGTMDFSNKGYLRFEALEVPLSADGVGVDIILGVMALLGPA